MPNTVIGFRDVSVYDVGGRVHVEISIDIGDKVAEHIIGAAIDLESALHGVENIVNGTKLLQTLQ